MNNTDKVDLRIQRTREAIRNTFEEMICEMDYEKITIKELTERARINRKTFYLHYNTLDDLLRELQSEMTQNFINRTVGLNPLHDIDRITREFFLFHEEYGKLGDRITGSGSYDYISRQMTRQIMEQTWEKNGEPFVQRIIMTFVAQSTLAMYRQWISDGKKIPLEEIIELCSRLIRGGTNSLNESGL